MDKILYEKVKAYRASLAIIKEMRSIGIISENDFAKVSLVLAEKHGINPSTIFSEIDLLYVDGNGNIRH